MRKKSAKTSEVEQNPENLRQNMCDMTRLIDPPLQGLAVIDSAMMASCSALIFHHFHGLECVGCRQNVKVLSNQTFLLLFSRLRLPHNPELQGVHMKLNS